MSDAAIRTDFRPDGVAVLTFDQPGSRANILSKPLWTEFEAALTPLASRTDLKGLVLVSAKPGIFIAGADLKFFQNLPGPNDPAVRDVIEHGLRVLELLEAMPFPTCAAIDGAALGGGLEVALACDYRVCGTNPRVELGLPEVKLGLIPGWGGTQRLPRVSDLATAAQMIATGTGMAGPQAKNVAWIVEEIAPSELLLDRSVDLLLGGSIPWREDRSTKKGPVRSEKHAAIRMPPEASVAVCEVFSVLTRGAALPLHDAIKLETEAFLRLAGSDESKRLIAEFFASRKKA